jgi:ribosomal protein S18 acetylase RimI-like enzyme
MFDLEQLPLRSFRRYLSLEGADLIVADHTGDCIGYALATYRRGGRIGRIISLAVVDHASGRGIGRALVEAIVAAARLRTIAVLRLEVRADNLAAQRLYERAGFHRTGLKRDYYADLCDAVSYERVISE